MPSSFKIARVAGIDIGIHYTWLFAFVLIAWSLAAGFFPSTFVGFDMTTYWVLGAVGALGLFASVLFHELSHSFVALARGMSVHSITLFIFGGVSNLQSEAEEAKDEFLVAVVGPLSSFVLAAVFWALEQPLSPSSPVGALFGYLAFVNLMLGVFNLVPGFPLDGGRVLRSIVWAVTGSLRRATAIASFAGQGIGFLLIFWGLSRIFAGDFLGGLWTAFIGWFLNNAAEGTRQQQAVREQLRGVRVVQVMDPRPPVVEPGLSVYDFVFEHVLFRGQRAVLVGRQGRLLGIASITDAKRIPQTAWPTTPIEQIMSHVPLRSVPADADLAEGLRLLTENGLNQVPVVDDGTLLGMLSRADVLRFLQYRDELGVRGARAQTTSPRAVG
ncbi:MAG: site-2 protease family protein [Chloroflexota bacterium]|nr:site-2 protease family protein [Chloroflexota bacterium]